MQRRDQLESVLGRLEDLDTASLSNLVARLARERRLLNSVFNVLREGILVIDADGTIAYANETARSMLRLKADDLGQLRLWRLIPDLARTLDLGPWGHLRESGHITRELRLTYPEARFVRLYLVPFDDEVEGVRLARYAVILSDITQEHDRTQQELESARVRSVLQLAAGVAHELGNPLNTLDIHLQLLERQLRKLPEGPGAEKLRRSVEVSRGEVQRLDGIIRHFLEAVRPQPPDFAELDLMQVVEEVLEFVGSEFSDREISIDVETPPRLPLIDGDRNQLKQVLFNLLKNAREAMPGGGQLRIRSFADDELVTLQIGDTGQGISEEDLGQVFEPYFTTKADGHGLGMMICERIMRDHGGQIGLESREGVGTLVTLVFPQKHRRIRQLEAARQEDGIDA